MEIVLDDIEVMYVPAVGGPAGARQAFDKLESFFPSLRGRKFYGTARAVDYRACVAVQPEDQPSELGLATWVIPGGRYARKRVKDWSRKIPQLGEIFTSMAEEDTVDPTRPCIEFYSSESELQLFLPVLRDDSAS